MALPIFKLLVLCINLASYSGDDVTTGQLQLIPSELGEMIHVEYQLTGQYEKELQMIVPGQEPMRLRIVSVDNGLYEVSPIDYPDEEALELDLVSYYSRINWDTLWTEKQVLDYKEETITLTPLGSVLYVNWNDELLFVLQKPQ